MPDEVLEALEALLPFETIDPSLWAAAVRATRSRPGMGAIRLDWHPYTCKWECRIDYSDDQRHIGLNSDVNAAIREAVENLVLNYKEPEGSE